ncbi:MAG: multicopper oxidase domain-containing protein, partial [Desertimonas sp.]
MTSTIEPNAPEQQSTKVAALQDRLDRLEAKRDRSDGWVVATLGIATVVALAAIVTVGFIARRDGGSDGGGAAAPQMITADLTEYAIALSADSVTPGSTIQVVNSGTIAHTLGVEGTDIITDSLNPGDGATLDLSGLPPGEYLLWCDIAGHLDSGMSHPLTISESATAAASGETAAGGAMTVQEHAAMTVEEGAAMDQVMMDSILAFPAATEGMGNQVIEPEILPNGVKHFELTAAITEWEVSPGEIVEAWTYNGMVPGPRFNLEVGDEIEVTLHNELPIGTDIHWHGVEVPNDQDGVAPLTQDLIASGETYTYHFTITEPAIAMYHAHAHGQEAIPNGLFGTMFIGDIAPPAGQTISGIEIPEDIEISQHIPMVANDAGTIGLSLNGKSFPATEPYIVNEGDWIAVTYYNEGLQVHPMHLHGFEQIVYAKDGEPLDHPYAADTILVSPGERY